MKRRFQTLGSIQDIPRHAQVRTHLIERVRQGDFNSNGRLPTEHELARYYDVSRSTVRRALQEMAALGLIERRQGAGTFIIDRAAARPHPHMEGVGLAFFTRPVKRTRTIGVVMESVEEDLRRHLAAVSKDTDSLRPNIFMPDTPYFSPILRGIDSVCHKHRYHPQILQVNRVSMLAPENRFFCWLLEEGALEGLILLSAFSEHDVSTLAAMGIPLVLNDIEYPSLNVPCVRRDLRWETQEAVRYLHKRGHKRIAVLNAAVHPGRENVVNFKSEIPAGYRAGLAEARLALDEELIRITGYRMQDASEAARELLGMADPPTAVIALGYVWAGGVYEAAKGLGLRVPEDFEIVQMGSPVGEAHPGLMFVNSLYEMACTSTHILMDLISGKEVKERRVLLRGKPVFNNVQGMLCPRQEGSGTA